MRKIVESRKTKVERQMARIFKSISVFALCSLFFVPSFAQEAFYIYRNDGDFNGFFYDEVVEMRYSKIDFDSVEHEQCVTYEVQLADTVYRIPLSAIDSIGFQQPEIKLNPKVKFMERDGYIPYFHSILGASTNSPSYRFNNDLPVAMIPQPGDVLLGLPTDPIAQDKYYVGDIEGSWGCVVEYVEHPTNSSLYTVHGRPIEQLSDVFEQYITVEEVGIDKEGKIRRRVAGCTPDGMPRKAKEGDDGKSKELTLINVNGTFTRNWKPDENSSIDLSADLTVKLVMRATYNISWTKFYVSITKDLKFSLKPSFGLSVSKSWEGQLADWFDVVPGIGFPAACPVLETKPVPSFFMRAEGKIEARFNLPKQNFGFGDELIMDSRKLFPLSYSVHWVPDDGEVDDELLDVSSSVQIAGSAQMGVVLKAPISTASWFKKVLYAETGLYLYIGPKIGGQVNITADALENGGIDLYSCLTSSYLYVTLLSFDLEAKGKAAAFFNDPDEKTFWSKSWEFLSARAYLAPRFDRTTVVYDINTKRPIIQVRPKADKYFGYTQMQIGIYKGKELIKKPLKTFSLYQSAPDSIYSYTVDDNELPYGSYTAAPIVTVGSKGTFDLVDHSGIVSNPFYSKLQADISTDWLTYEAIADTQSILLTTNGCPQEFISIHGAGSSWIPSSLIKKELVDSIAGTYNISVPLEHNRSIFDKTGKVVINVGAGADNGRKEFEIEVQQKAPTPENSIITGSVYAGFTPSGEAFQSAGWSDSALTITRYGADSLHFEGTCTKDYTDDTHWLTQHVEGEAKRLPGEVNSSKFFYYNCKATTHRMRGNRDETVVVYFTHPEGSTSNSSVKVTAGTYDCIITNKDGTQTTKHDVFDASKTNEARINLYAEPKTTTTP